MKRSLAALGLCVYIAASCLLAFFFPQSVLAFLMVEASLLLLYYVDAPRQTKISLGALVLVMLFPILGWANGYYLEVAIQIGIFVALALGLNIVVGFVGLLNLGFVAFYAIGAYLWAIFGSPQANAFIPGGLFPLSPNWFFVFLFLSIVVGALTGFVLGLPVSAPARRLSRDRYPGLRRSRARAGEQSRQADQFDQRPERDRADQQAAAVLSAGAGIFRLASP